MPVSLSIWSISWQHGSSMRKAPTCGHRSASLRGQRLPGIDIWKGHLFLIYSTDKNMETVSAHLFDGPPKPVINKSIQLVWLVIIKKQSLLRPNLMTPLPPQELWLLLRLSQSGNWWVWGTQIVSIDSLSALCLCESQQGAVFHDLPAIATKPWEVLWVNPHSV